VTGSETSLLDEVWPVNAELFKEAIKQADEISEEELKVKSISFK